MNKKSLYIYFFILLMLSSGLIVGMRVMGKQGTYLAQGYMLTPAIAAILTRLFFYEKKFQDANLRLGRIKDYFRYWSWALGITVVSFTLYTAVGAIRWDPTGGAFLDRLGEQFALSGQDMLESLPPGFTPQMMLLVFTIGGLTLFNILPGLVTGFGEEFGHRGFMFPQLYRIKPWTGFIIGGLIWFAWHLPLMLVIPSSTSLSITESMLNLIILAVGSICTFIYLAYVYVKSHSIFVTSIAHIAMNNAAAALSYYVIVRDQLLANACTTLTMVLVVGFLYITHQLNVFEQTCITDSTEVQEREESIQWQAFQNKRSKPLRRQK
jgi:membrane protease YdiL (CAAX protease family)